MCKQGKKTKWVRPMLIVLCRGEQVEILATCKTTKTSGPTATYGATATSTTACVQPFLAIDEKWYCHVCYNPFGS